ncbi:MAG: MarR family transcriptional regulator [Oscillospiraceae bacterium]|nr:MarR family transcriptional regulator [Oscillospiraceae bacterium]
MNEFETSLNDMLVDTYNKITQYEETSLKEVLNAPVTITQIHMIEAIGKLENEEATVSKIAASLDIAPPTATVLVKKLEEKGFVQKVPCDKDGRQIKIRLTRDGERINRAHRVFHQRMIRNISRQFAPEEQAVLLKLLKGLNGFFS